MHAPFRFTKAVGVSPSISIVALLMPAVSPTSTSVTSTFQPRDSAQRWYVDEHVCPVAGFRAACPALMLKMQFFYPGSVRNTLSSSASNSLKKRAMSRSISL